MGFWSLCLLETEIIIGIQCFECVLRSQQQLRSYGDRATASGLYTTPWIGAQWLSGRVLDSRPRGREFEPHRRHCVVSLSKAHLSLLSNGSTQYDLSINF